MSEDEEPTLAPGQLYRVAWVVYLIIAIIGVAWIGLEARDDGPCAGEGICLALFVDTQRWPVDVFLGIATAALIVGAWELVRRRVLPAKVLEERLAQLVGTLRPDEAVAIALLSGFCEEFFFRGAVQGSLGWPLATVLFALMHAGPGRAQRVWALYAGVAGLVFAGLTEWRQSLLAPIIAHAAVNAFGLWRLSRSREVA